MGDFSNAGVVAVVCLVVAVILVPAYLGSHLGKNRAVGSPAGFLLGLFFSLLGVVIVMCFPEQGSTRTCPYCAEKVKLEARICKHCRRDISPIRTANIADF